jgi:hypothetical protein
MYTFTPDNLLNWIVAFCLFEIPMANFYLAISDKNSNVADWYSNKTINIWNVIAQDSLYVMCGIILTLRLFNYLTKKNYLSKNFRNFILTFILIQLIGDLTFAQVILRWTNTKATKWTNYFKNYINNSGFDALIGDSLYVIFWSLSFYLVSNYIKSYDIKIFIICLFFFLVSAYSVQ